MRFILQLFHAPAVRTVSEAQAHTAKRHAATADQRARFRAFAESISVAHSECEGPTTLEDAVFIVTLPEPPPAQTLVRLARAAASAELHLLDPHHRQLYRADGCLVHANGSVAPMPLLPAEPAPPPLTKETARAQLARQLAQRLVPHGYQAAAGHMLVRRTGAVKQGIGLAAGERAGAVVLQAVFAFHCHDVSQVWREALGLTAATATPDVTLRAGELAPGALPPTDEITVRTVHDLSRWADAFGSWFTGVALPRLDKVQRAADLGALALSDHQRKQLARRRDLPSSERFSRLVLAAAFDADRLPAWTEVLRSNAPGGSPVPQADQHSIDRLVAFLRS
ncbi:MAG TPA: hypothetical protein VFY73_30195 [Ideonella sp.]|uniref:hypothetical protein n=1 Tax=Ideonella sp. TaxID=1929293 RepID=UPI002E357EB9|nr:hypothetical protein [Ideonella sp.]HEX5688312.1 hypothetical protein [Ideonella sp.]